MEYEKKLKKRLYLAISYIVIGVLLLLLCAGRIIENEFMSSFGVVLVVMGVARIRQYRRITKDEESIRRQRIAESDERNLAIWNKARSLTFGIYIALAGIAVIVLEMIDRHDLANPVALSVCALVFIYWICYLIVRRKY